VIAGGIGVTLGFALSLLVVRPLLRLVNFVIKRIDL